MHGYCQTKPQGEVSLHKYKHWSLRCSIHPINWYATLFYYQFIFFLDSTGVYISLHNTYYHNNSNILITDIGEGTGRVLLCHTDLLQCCKSDQTNNRMALGEWFYPNYSTVDLNVSNENFYKNRGNRRVRLHRRGNSTSPTGKFCCEIPDASYTLIKMCVNLGELQCT